MFLIALFTISVHLPVRGGFAYAMSPHNPHLSHGLFTARSNPPLFSDFLVSAARASGIASVRKRRAVFTLHSDRNTNLPALYSSIYSST